MPDLQPGPEMDAASFDEAIAEACGLTIGYPYSTCDLRREYEDCKNMLFWRESWRRFHPSENIAQTIELANKRFDSWELIKHSAKLFRFTRWEKSGLRRGFLGTSEAHAIGLALIAAKGELWIP